MLLTRLHRSTLWLIQPRKRLDPRQHKKRTQTGQMNAGPMMETLSLPSMDLNDSFDQTFDPTFSSIDFANASPTQGTDLDLLSSLPTPQAQSQYPDACANLEAFSRDIQPLQHTEVEPRPYSRIDEQPWAGIVVNQNNSMPSPMNCRLSGPSPGQMNTSMSVNNNSSLALYKPTNIGKALSDSGYGTHDLKSPTSQSVYSDVMWNQQGGSSLADGMGAINFQVNNDAMTLFEPYGVFAQPTPNPSLDMIFGTPEEQDRPPYKCPQCNFCAKNKSERKYCLPPKARVDRRSY